MFSVNIILAWSWQHHTTAKGELDEGLFIYRRVFYWKDDFSISLLTMQNNSNNFLSHR